MKRPVVAADLPTMVEAGVAGFDITTWFGLDAPAGDPIGGPQPEFAAFVERDLVKWAKAAALAGLIKK